MLLPQQELIAVEGGVGLRVALQRRGAGLGPATWAFDELAGEFLLQ